MIKKVLLAALATLTLGMAWYQKSVEKRPVLSGFFESQPTLVSSRVQGRVLRLAVSEGQYVTSNQLLMEMESKAAELELESLKHQVEQARQQYLETRAGTRPEELRRQQALVDELSAGLAKAMSGARAEELEQAEAAEREARAYLRQVQRGPSAEEQMQLKARLSAAETEERLTRQELQRYTLLWRQDELSQIEYDRQQASAEKAYQARLEAEQAWLRARRGSPREEVEQAHQRWIQSRAKAQLIQNGSRSEDVLAARARLEQAQALLDQLRNGLTQEQKAQRKTALQAAQSNLKSQTERMSERLVRAPRAGIVDRIPVALGDLANPGTTLVRILDPKDVWIKVYVPEDKLASIQVLSPVRIQVDGLDGELKGHVESIATRGEFKPANLQSPEERARQVFAVKVRLDQDEPRVRPGLYASILEIGSWRP